MDCVSPNTIWPHRPIEWTDKHEEYPVTVPCGKCIPCLVSKRADWTFRLEQEYKVSSNALFVTLTYDVKHCPASLDKRHLQLYFKKLRKQDQKENGQTRIRYYAVGEYGTIGGRPHYHILLFNVSEQLARACWRDVKGKPIGIVHIGKVTAASVAYVTKYMIQTDKDDPRWNTLQRPFALMSRAYGIGAHYLSDNMVNWHRNDDKNYAIRDGQKVRLPRFYKSKIWYDMHDKERISKAAVLLLSENKKKELEYYEENYGKDAYRVMKESRDALISRIKTKVAFTQTL